jgi:hypothetical protein
VTISDRDRRILLILIPIVVVVAYWFLLLSPKRDDLSAARDERDQAVQAAQAAEDQANALERARQTFAADYAAVVRLGKAIPATIDSPSLLVQLDRASKGTHIDFKSVAFGDRTAGVAVPTATTTTTGAEQPAGNAAAGGAPAQTGAGGAAESAGNAVNEGNQASTNVNTASGGTTTTTTTTTGTTAAPASTTPPPTLDTVALTFNFSGTYFDLADFFHRLKRYVYVANKQIFVRGRLMTIDTLTFSLGQSSSSASTSGNGLTATVGATIYLSPKGEGVTGGATPAGPAGTTTTETTTTPAGAETSQVPLATVGSR